MAKLMPGRIRNEGIALYENGDVTIEDAKNQFVYAKIGEENLRYSLDDDAVICSCQLFQKKDYCQHLAAFEYYLKNDESGKELLAKLENQEEDQQEKERQDSLGSLFLKEVLGEKPQEERRYALQVVGTEEEYRGQFIWTLRIRRHPSDRTYVVRDILAFLHTIAKNGYYQIGKSYYEALYVEQFDAASQDLIHYLLGLLKNADLVEEPFFLTKQGRYLHFPASMFEDGVNYLQKLEQFELQYGFVSYPQVLFQDLYGDSPLIQTKVEEKGDSYRLQLVERPFKRLYEERFLFYKGTFYHLSLHQVDLLQSLRTIPLDASGKKSLQFDRSQSGRLAASLVELGRLGSVRAPKSLEIHDFGARFDFSLGEEDRVSLKMVFDFGSAQVDSKEALASLPFASNFEKEEEIFRTLKKAGFTADFESSRPALKPAEVYGFFQEVLPHFRRLGQVSLSADLQALFRVEQPEIRMDLQGSLLDISFDFSGIPNSEVEEVLEALWQREHYVVTENGQLYVFDEETLHFRDFMNEMGVERQEDGHFLANRLAALRLAQLVEERKDILLGHDFKQMVTDLRHPEQFALGDLDVQADLRDYQELGVRWLNMLSYYHLGGILADDMGLGKTLQTIAFLTGALKEEGQALILAPSSLIYNWQKEFEKFAPQMDVAVIYGLKPYRDQVIAEKHQVMITSYASFRQDKDLYADLDLQYMMMDEAQVMKNGQTKIAHAVQSVPAQHIFALSGTPIENHLREIWSIFHIVLPGLLPAQNDFLKLPPEVVARSIQPFILRRRKEDVLLELPDLTEVVYYNELSDEQKTVYLAQLQQMQEQIRDASDEEVNRRQIEILSGIMRLRQICDTPKLFMEDYEADSGKLESLRTLLQQIQDGNHRVLIFSQFRGMLDIIEDELTQMEMESFKITGSTPAKDRQAMTDAFNEGKGHAFLISLKAGGVGLNLTGADTVILVDLWWNPAVEAQAISRAHRMGQKENVEVYRLITRGTIEEKILELQESKKHLISTVLDGGETSSSLSVDEIREILGLAD